jgi:hypothetical protein
MPAVIRLAALKPILVRNYLAGVNTFLRGKPAIGKTMTIESFVEEMKKRIEGFQSWNFYAPTMSPMDIQASAPNYEKGTLQMFNNEALPNHYTSPDAVGVVFFGELPNADPATAKLLQKYVNGEDMSGVLKKPKGVMVIADGNRIEDKSGVQQQGRAFMSRFEQLEAYTDANDNIKYAAAQAWHPSVQTFFKDNPALIDNYDEVFETTSAARQRGANAQRNNGGNEQSEEGKLGIWANMRAWGRISAKEYAADTMKSAVTQTEVAGNVGMAVGAQFEAHKKILSSLSSYEDIIASPDTVKLPAKLDEVYMLSILVALKASVGELPQVATFGKRLPLEMQAVLLRNMAIRKNIALGDSKAYIDWIVDPKLSSLLNGR